jgi:hypothetical protein
MRKLSLWAKRHTAQARIIIIISRILLIWIGYWLGTELSKSAIALSPLWIYFFISVFFVAGATYPVKMLSENYTKRKLYDLIIASCGFLMVLCFTSELNKPFITYQTAEASLPVNPSAYKYAEAKKLLEQFQKGEKTKFNAKEKRIIKKEFNYQLVQYAKAKLKSDKTTGEQAALIILACIAAVGLLYLLAAIACSLSCNGSDAAAVIVGVLGTAAIIWGLIAIIRKINHQKKKTK